MQIPFTLLLLAMTAKVTWAAQCACATTSVHVRNGAGTTHAILSTLHPGHCLTFKNHRQDVNGASWVNVDYNGQDGWIHEGYVTIGACAGTVSTGTLSTGTENSNLQLPGCPHIISRAEWGARDPTHAHIRMPGTPKYMFIHHGASAPCFTKSDCIEMVKQYQDYHMDGHGWSDIGYSFIVGEDGNVYEGRGWDSIGAHTHGYNTVGIAACMIGNFMTHPPNEAGLNAVKSLIQCAQDNGKLTSNYTLRGHRDVGITACPGDKYYDLIIQWPHY